MLNNHVPQEILDSPVGELVLISEVVSELDLGLYAIQRPCLDGLPVALNKDEVNGIYPMWQGEDIDLLKNKPAYTDIVLQDLAASITESAAQLLYIASQLLDNCGLTQDAETVERLSSISKELANNKLDPRIAFYGDKL